MQENDKEIEKMRDESKTETMRVVSSEIEKILYKPIPV